MTQHRTLLIYYFSGTGNAKNVALWLSEAAAQQGFECRVFNIGTANHAPIEPPAPDALVAFISPIHGFNYPPVMLHFLKKFPKGHNHVLLMNTRAGMLIGKWITPGLTGIAFYVAALLLTFKGYSIRAMFPVDLPSNWISVHPGLNERTVRYLHERNKERVTAFARKVLSGKRDYTGLRDIIQDTLISPIALGYYFFGRFVFAKTYVASDDCNDCDVCIKGCPVNAIVKIDGRPYWTFRCESCMRCMSTCPRRAIETAHGFIVTVSVIYSFALLTLVHVLLDALSFEMRSAALRFIVENGVFLLFLAASYRINHYLMRFNFFKKAVVATSLTKYSFWGRRYRALK